MKKIGLKSFALLFSMMMFICSIQVIHAEENVYSHSDSAISGDVTLKVEWNEPVLGQPTTFHVSATGGSGIYKFNMETPSYTNPDVISYESVADPSRGEWTKYSDECTSQDYTFTMMASGTYNFRFHVMDIKAGVTYLRTSTYIQVSSLDYPSVNSIVQSAVAQCNNETDGSDYQKALWLHDWLLNQLEYDNTLKWSSAESALTRGLGTCQAYESAYAILLSAAGIENAETRDTYDGHTWNAVKLDGDWYQVDCTWDDSNDNWYGFDQKHLYFGLTDELMSQAHPGHNKICNSSDYTTISTSLLNNYYVKNGEALEWANNYKAKIQKYLDKRITQFSIKSDNFSWPSSISSIQNGVIAYILNIINWNSSECNVDLSVKANFNEFVFNVSYSEENNSTNLDVLAMKYNKIIKDGNYTITSKINDNYVFGINDNGNTETENVELRKRKNSKSQIWNITHDKEGYVIFTNIETGKVLSVSDEAVKNESNIIQKEADNTKAQKWIVRENGTIISALNERYVIDVYCGLMEEGSNIQIYELNGGENQKWIFTQNQFDKQTIADGNYV